MRLVIANKRYSSWSMRPWLVMKAYGLPFEETLIRLKQPDTAEKIKSVSPSGTVPALIDGEATVWDSLAIIEYLADKFPEVPIWPEDPVARGHARAISAEMHSGFTALRSACNMNIGKRFPHKDRGEAVLKDVARIIEIFGTARARFGGDGDFLFGEFCAADAMYAPVVTRFYTYSIHVDATTKEYMDAVRRHPAFVKWQDAALAEPWFIAEYEANEPVVEDFNTVTPA